MIKGISADIVYNIYVTNTSADAKIVLYKQGFLSGNDVSHNLVQFNCMNATGARLTSKETVIQAKPCSLIALVEDKDCTSDKTK